MHDATSSSGPSIQSLVDHAINLAVKQIMSKDGGVSTCLLCSGIPVDLIDCVSVTSALTCLSQRYRTQSTCKRTTPVPVLSRTKNKGPGRGPSQVKHPGRKGGRGKSNQVEGRQVLHPTPQVEPQQARPSHSTSRRGKEKAAGKGKGAQKGAV